MQIDSSTPTHSTLTGNDCVLTHGDQAKGDPAIITIKEGNSPPGGNYSIADLIVIIIDGIVNPSPDTIPTDDKEIELLVEINTNGSAIKYSSIVYDFFS